MASIYKRSGKGSYIIAWVDHDGRRRERSSRTTDRRAAERIAAKLEADAALRREGVVDHLRDNLAAHGRRTVLEHVSDYIEHCRVVEQVERHVSQKDRHLREFLSSSGVTYLSSLDARSLEGEMARLRDAGLSARTVNIRRQTVVAMANWLVRTGRLASNPLQSVPKLDEQKDRRRVRRALTEDELARLFEATRPRGRALWFMTAALAGLRKGELLALRWGDVDLDARVLVVRNSKAGRIDRVPLHPQLADELAQHRPSLALPSVRVFPRAVTDRTRQADFRRANIELVDAGGRVADLHACRTSLGTRLARQGVVPQVAKQIMRHADYRTTERHYTVLELEDSARAIGKLPAIERDPEREQATGTAGLDPQQIPQQSEHDLLRQAATERDAKIGSEASGNCGDSPQDVLPAPDCDAAREDALERVTGLEPATFSLGSCWGVPRRFPTGSPESGLSAGHADWAMQRKLLRPTGLRRRLRPGAGLPLSERGTSGLERGSGWCKRLTPRTILSIVRG